MKTIWKVLAWLFAACGLFAYLLAWGELWFGWHLLRAAPEYLFDDAIATAVFAIFFLIWGRYGEEKT